MTIRVDRLGPLIDRRAFVATAASVIAGRHLTPRTHWPRPLPTASQLLWQRDELAIFVHFGINTFTDREWGDGTENPALFQPTALDAAQWARAARAGGFRAMILTAKHHDGFCLWPTRTTSHSVASSPWRSGDGDVVQEFVDACRHEGLRIGFYLSPWDRNAPAYGDSPRYDQMYCDQLTELLTRYGPVHEVWFDGANGEGPGGKRQVYDWPRYWQLVRRLQPEAVIFSDAGPDVRWIGNESGVAGDTNWSTVDPDVGPWPGGTGADIMAMLREGDPAGTVWRPGETDTSIRPGWFWHPAEDDRVRTTDALVDLYRTSVGRNSKLLLNVPPTRAGLFHETDAARLAAMRVALGRIVERDVMTRKGVTVERSRTPGLPVIDVDLGATRTLDMITMQEDITRGQAVARYRVDGWTGSRWQLLVRGTTIGYRKIDTTPDTAVRRIRVTVEAAIGEVAPIGIAAYARE